MAKELIYKYAPFVNGCPQIFKRDAMNSLQLANALACALITVDQLISNIMVPEGNYHGVGYWKAVRKEIENFKQNVDR